MVIIWEPGKEIWGSRRRSRGNLGLMRGHEAEAGKARKRKQLFANILTSNLSPTESDRLRWWLRFAPLANVVEPLGPTGKTNCSKHLMATWGALGRLLRGWVTSVGGLLRWGAKGLGTSAEGYFGDGYFVVTSRQG